MEKLQELLQLMQDDTVSKKEIEQFLRFVLTFISKSQDSIEKLTQENLDTLQKAVEMFNSKTNDYQNELDDIIEQKRQQIQDQIDSIEVDFNAKIDAVESLLEEVWNIKATPGKDGYTPIKGKDYFDGRDGLNGKDGQDAIFDEQALIKSIISKIPKPQVMTDEDLIQRINNLPDDDMHKIDASHIKNLPTPKGGGMSSAGRQLSNLFDVKITNLANNDVLKWNSTSRKWENGAGTGIALGGQYEIPYMNSGANAYTTKDTFKYNEGRLHLDLTSNNPANEGVLNMLIQAESIVYKSSLLGIIETQYLLAQAPLTDGYNADIGSLGSDNQYLFLKYYTDSTDWGKILYQDKNDIIRNPRYPIDGSSGLLFDTGTGGFQMGDLLGIADNIVLYITAGQIVFGNFANTAIYIDDPSGQFYWQFGGANTIGVNSGGMTFPNSQNLTFGTGAGTKLGTATNEKIGIWNATPIIQPTTGVASATFVANTSANPAFKESTYDGYTVSQVVKALRNIGLLA